MTGLAVYLNDQLALATVGVELFRRSAPALPEVRDLVPQVEADREALREVLRRLDVGEQRWKTSAAWLSEKAGRLKLNGGLLSRPPVTDLIELIGLLAVAQAAAARWRLLAAWGDDRLDQVELNRLAERSAWLADELAELHRKVGVRVLSTQG